MNFKREDLMFLINVAENGVENQEEEDRYQKLKMEIDGSE